MFFKAAPMPVKRGYQGRFCDIYRYEFDAQNVQTALDAGLVDETTTPEDRFRPDDGLTCGELAEFMVRSLQPEGKESWICRPVSRRRNGWDCYGMVMKEMRQ